MPPLHYARMFELREHIRSAISVLSGPRRDQVWEALAELVKLEREAAIQTHIEVQRDRSERPEFWARVEGRR